MDMEKPNEPLFKINEERLEKFLKEMEVKGVMQNLNESDYWVVLLFMICFAMPNDSECDKKENNHE